MRNNHVSYLIFTIAICSEDKEIGPCRGSFPRWYFDTAMQKCLPFNYGGCRGNNNRFMNQEECVRMCQTKQPLPVPNRDTIGMNCCL